MNCIVKKLSQHAIFSIALMFAFTVSFSSANAKIVSTVDTSPSKIIAKINGQPIYEQQVDTVIKSRFGGTGPQVDQKKKIQIQKKALDEIITTELFYQEGQKLKVPNIDEEIDNLVKTFKSHPLGHYSNMSDERLKDIAKRQIYSAKYFEVNKLYTPDIPESEIRNFYNQSKNSYASKVDAVRARHIFVASTEEMTEEQKTIALNKINDAKESLSEGMNFAEVAELFSEDVTAYEGGDLGVIDKGFMPKEFDSAAFTIELNKPSEIIKTEFGYHILMIVETIPKGTVPKYENLRDFFKTFLQQQKSKQVIAEHIVALRNKSHIEYFIED